MAQIDTKYYIENSINYYSGPILYACLSNIIVTKNILGKPIKVGDIGKIVGLEHFSDYEYLIHFEKTNRIYKIKQEYVRNATIAEQVLYGSK